MDSKFLIDTAAAAIWEYLKKYPESVDSVEGIHSWWIEWQDRVESLQITEQALELLEAQGMMEKVHVGNRLLWRRRR